jgi:hypothetical protein
MPRRVSRAPSGLTKEEIAQALSLLLSEAPQLVHRELERRSWQIRAAPLRNRLTILASMLQPPAA